MSDEKEIRKSFKNYDLVINKGNIIAALVILIMLVLFFIFMLYMAGVFQ